MTDFFGHVAGAALPVAVTLLVLTAIARGVIWAGIEGDEQRYARQYLGALASWCLIAAGTYAFAICAAGQAAPLPLVAAIALAVAAIVLRSDETAAVRTDEPKPAAPKPDVRRSPAPETLGPETGGRRAFPEAVPAHGRRPEPAAHSLWDEPTENAKPTGLWAR